VAGVLALPDACALVAARGRLMQALPPDGAMVALAATEDEVLPMLTGDVCLAAVNGPASVVISGAKDAVARVADRFTAQGRRTRRLRVSHAFHSALMDPIMGELADVVGGLRLEAPSIPMVSNLTGMPVEGKELSAPEYWARHARETVRFHDGIRALAQRGVTAFVELGPDAVLSQMIESIRSDSEEWLVAPTVRHDRPEWETALTALGRIHLSGALPDWSAVFAGTGARPVDLPTYAFQRQHYWLRAAASRQTIPRGRSAWTTPFWSPSPTSPRAVVC
jgi:acyl transferase domain-containing protein